MKIDNHLYQDVVINEENISLDPSVYNSHDNLDSPKQIPEVISSFKALSNEILNTFFIPIIFESGETLEKAIEHFEVISNFEEFTEHINTPISIILE